jgi:hypothetical protein
MHVVFMPYGDIYSVERFLNDMKAQKHQITFTSPDGKQQKQIYISAQLRVLPFGFYEYVFPKEDLDIVLTTLLREGGEDRYSMEKVSFMGLTPVTLLRKFLKCDPLPEFKRENKMLWVMDNVNITVLGYRKDLEMEEPALSSLPGWKHEAI